MLHAGKSGCSPTRMQAQMFVCQPGCSYAYIIAQTLLHPYVIPGAPIPVFKPGCSRNLCKPKFCCNSRQTQVLLYMHERQGAVYMHANLDATLSVCTSECYTFIQAQMSLYSQVSPDAPISICKPGCFYTCSQARLPYTCMQAQVLLYRYVN